MFVVFHQNDPGTGVIAGSPIQAEYFFTYVKALIYCKVPKPESGSVPGSTDYQFNSLRKSIFFYFSMGRNKVCICVIYKPWLRGVSYMQPESEVRGSLVYHRFRLSGELPMTEDEPLYIIQTLHTGTS